MDSVQEEELDKVKQELACTIRELEEAKTGNFATVKILKRRRNDLLDKERKLSQEQIEKLKEDKEKLDKKLKEANEELKGANEELKEANEELKEELKEANEELKEANEKLRRDSALTSIEWFKQILPKLPRDFSGGHGMRNAYWYYAPSKVKNWNDFEEEAIRCCDSVNDSRTFRRVRVEKEFFDSHATERIPTSFFEQVLHEMVGFYPGNDLLVSHSPVLTKPPSGLSESARKAWNLAHPTRVIPDLMVKKGTDYCFVAELKPMGTFRNSGTDTVPNLVTTYTMDQYDNDMTRSLIDSEILQQLMKYLVTQRLGYGVVTSADISYFVRRVSSGVGSEEELNFNCLEVSNGITWDSKDPTLLESLYYVFDQAVKEISIYRTYEFKHAEKEKTPEVSPESHSERSRDTSEYRPSQYSEDDSPPERRISTRSSGNRDLPNTDAVNLHLDNAPYASGGSSGNVVLGVVKGQRVAVKLAPLDSCRGKALLNEVEAYIKLRKCWGQCTPKLVDYGTTVHGKVFYVATEFIDGSTIGLKPLTQKVAGAARKALQAIHVSGMLHGDIHAENILVVGSGVRFIDFGFARSSTSPAECMRECEKLDDIILQSTRTSKWILEKDTRC